jgi:hypothetical protein
MLKKAKSNRPTANVIESDTSGGDESGSEEEDGIRDVEDAGQPNVMDLDARHGQLAENQDIISQGALVSTCQGPPPSTASTTASSPILAPRILGMSDEEYEFSVMDTYINAKSCNVCWRKVSDDYFGNKKGMRPSYKWN